MGLFTSRIAYKPFEYPEYYTEGWLKQAQAFWLHTEISMQSDLKDWNEKSLKLYNSLVDGGVCREQARGVLPQNMYTEYYGTANLSNMWAGIR